MGSKSEQRVREEGVERRVFTFFCEQEYYEGNRSFSSEEVREEILSEDIGAWEITKATENWRIPGEPSEQEIETAIDNLAKRKILVSEEAEGITTYSLRNQTEK